MSFVATCVLLVPAAEHFTGLHPQLLDESFITDLEQRFEQGQHLHTVACSSTSSIDDVPHTRSMICTGSAGAAADAAALNGPLNRGHCPSLSAASSGTVAVAGSGICLRLHVLTRGMEQLSKLRGSGAESIGRCLERLHSSVEKIRKQHVKPRLQDLVGADSDDEDTNSQPEVRAAEVWGHLHRRRETTGRPIIGGRHMLHAYKHVGSDENGSGPTSRGVTTR